MCAETANSDLLPEKSTFHRLKMTETSAFSVTSSMMPGGIPRPVDHTPDENEFQMTLIPSTRIIFMCS